MNIKKKWCDYWSDYSHQMLGLFQREAGEQGFPNCLLVVVLLVEFVVEGDLGMKDATCHVDSKSPSHNLLLPNITQNDLILRNITQGPVAILTTFPSLLTCLVRFASRSNGSSNVTSSCPVVPVATRRGRQIWCAFAPRVDRGDPVGFAGIRRGVTKDVAPRSAKRTRKDKAARAGQKGMSRPYGRDSDNTNNSIIINNNTLIIIIYMI